MEAQSFDTLTTARVVVSPPSNRNRLLIPKMRLLDSPISESYQKASLRKPKPFQYFKIPIDLSHLQNKSTKISNNIQKNTHHGMNNGWLPRQTSSHNKRLPDDEGDSDMEDSSCENETDIDCQTRQWHKKRRLYTTPFVTTLSTQKTALRPGKCNNRASHDGDTKIREQGEFLVPRRRGPKIRWSQSPPSNSDSDDDDDDNASSTHFSLTSQKSSSGQEHMELVAQNPGLEPRRRGPNIQWSKHPPIHDDSDDTTDFKDDDDDLEDDDDDTTSDDDANNDDDATT
ncbi:hypothetical protein ACA910_015730 [Epithemia clementina (nom. ined.)]